ncbi:MAG: pirin family protein, partial [Bacteroidota bacterium]
GGKLRPYSNLFYWAYAEATTDSTIGLHPHEGFEIVSFVLKGNIRHFDTKLNAWKPLKAGDVQIIRAGNGISHAEFLAKNAAIFQIWFDPDLTKTLNHPASYDDYTAADLPVSQEDGISVRTFVGEGSPFSMETKGIEVQQFEFEKTNYRKPVEPGKIYSMYVEEGNFSVNGNPVKKDDFILLKDASELAVESDTPGKLFVIASPASVSYRTYGQMMQERMRA